MNTNFDAVLIYILFSNYFPKKYLCSHFVLTLSALRCFHWTLHCKFFQITCCTQNSQKTKIWLIRGLKSWACWSSERGYAIDTNSLKFWDAFLFQSILTEYIFSCFVCFKMHSLNSSLQTSSQATCLQIHYNFQKTQNLAYMRIEKLSLLNWRPKLPHFDVHLGST